MSTPGNFQKARACLLPVVAWIAVFGTGVPLPAATRRNTTSPASSPAKSREVKPLVSASPSDPWSDPIKVPEYPYTDVYLKKQKDAWNDRNLVQPFLKHIPDDKPWKNAAQEYFKKAFVVWETHRGFKSASEEGRKLLASGCDESLIVFFVSFFTSYLGKHTAEDMEAARTAFKRLDEEKYYPPAIVRMAGMAINNASQVMDSARSPEVDHRVTELAKESFLAGNYPGDDDYLFLTHTKAWPWGWNHFVNNYDDIEKTYETAKYPEWVKDCLQAAIEVKRAWDRRGPGYANTVSKDGWMGFKELYDLARDHYTAAWKLHPMRPDAASEMIGITMAGHGNPGDTMRLWFDRSISAQFDYIQAYDAVAWGLRPRWGGSVVKMIKFARLCADTRKFDTEVPEQFFRILENATEETDWRKVYRNPIASEAVVSTARGIADDPSRREDWKKQYSLAAVRAYLVGDGAGAVDALNKAGGELQTPAKELLYRRAGDFDKMKQEIAVLQSPSGKRYWAGEELYDAGDVSGAITAFEECEATLKAASDPLSTVPGDRARALRIEKSLGAGDWVKIPLDAGMWRFQGGEWKATSDGCLEISGTTNATSYASPIVGAKFELRCEIEVDSPTRDQASAGVLLGEHGTGYYVVCGFKQSRGVETLQASATDHWDAKTAHTTSVASRKSNTLLIRVADNHVTYHLNGIPVATNWLGNDSPLNKLHSRIGLGARDLQEGTTIRIRNLEVRTNFK